jgi:hypothetical protein
MSHSPIPPSLEAALTAEFGPEPRVRSLFTRFLSGECDLLETARGRDGDPWEVRRVASLLLQHQVLRIPPKRWQDFDAFFLHLGIKTEPGLHAPLDAEVLREGYSTTEICGFIREFLSNLGRAAPILRPIRGRRTSRKAWEDLLAYARQDCKLPLGRYLFTPDEVVARIRAGLRVSRGVRDPYPGWGFPIGPEADRPRPVLPRYEAAIAAGLTRQGTIHWVSETTSSELGSLVEYPLTTVVLVVKPPGSSIELELKRAGHRRSRPLSVVFEREDGPVPISHRLDGGSMGRALQWDAWAAGRFAHVYQAVHVAEVAEAPLAETLSVSTINSVPVGKGEASILSYFSHRGIFGEGFSEMRAAMGESTAAFTRERTWSLPDDLSGRMGLTVRFLNYTAPAQAVLAGTSSFRLDRIALYLSPEGPDAYFTRGLGVPWGEDDARRLAGTVLEEVLGVYDPPAGPYSKDYVDRAFAMPENRERADSIFLEVAREIGRVWGTLLGVRGFSRGESFVERNVGLKASWRDGQWRVGIVFMDHDDLIINEEAFAPFLALPGMLEDERYVGREMACLERIYRVGNETALAGLTALREQAARAYRKTQEAVRSHPAVRDMFSPAFIERLGDWDVVVQRVLGTPEKKAWKGAVRRLLRDRGYDEIALGDFEAFLRRTSFLYE